MEYIDPSRKKDAASSNIPTPEERNPISNYDSRVREFPTLTNLLNPSGLKNIPTIHKIPITTQL
ncbi:MAG: hypothetical protein GYB31_02540 [Bacteroidetes bacterium]|nr:hypothetical protein [Bacteroidota bacterium]